MAFTGKAIYGTNVFSNAAEDVSDIITMISPFETPLLDRLGDALRPARNVFHEWLEDVLNPYTIVSTSTVSTAATAIAVLDLSGNAVANYFQVGAIFKDMTTGEYIQLAGVTSGSNTITITRGFGGTSAATITVGDQLFMVSDAALEGADVTVDTSRARTRPNNYCQIFKKDIIVSGTIQQTTMLGGVTDELDYQRQQRTREAIRDLEKAAIQGLLSGNTLGSSSAYRTMRGAWDFIQTNVYSVATITDSWLNTIIQAAWQNGGGDLDLIIADANFKRIIDQFNSTRVQVYQGTTTQETYRNRVSFYQSTFGEQEVILGRWMPTNSLMVLSTQRVHIVPLQGRSFQYQSVAKTGDSEKGMVVGEYTLEVHNEPGLAKAYANTFNE
jgi:hypothetical protein